MTTPAALLAVHVSGPDVLIAAADLAEAEHHVARINAYLASLPEDGSDNWPVMRASVATWPYSAESHARALTNPGRWTDGP